MSIERILNSFRMRNAVWSKTMRSILYVCEIPSFRGWNDTILKIKKQIEEDEKDYKEELEKLENLYLEHLLVGEKAVKIFRMSPSKIRQLADSFLNYSIPPNVYNEAYPFPLGKEELQGKRILKRVGLE